MAGSSKPVYEKSAHQQYLENGLEDGFKSSSMISTAPEREDEEDDGNARDYRVEGNKTDAYVGVSPEYQTYANDTEAPLRDDSKSVEDKLLKAAEDTEKSKEAYVEAKAEAKADSDPSSLEERVAALEADKADGETDTETDNSDKTGNQTPPSGDATK